MQTAVNVNIRTELIQINVGANITNNYNFGQLPNLRKAIKIINIEAFSVTQVPLTPDGKNVITNAVLIKSFLKLVEVDRSNAEIRVFPLYSLQRTTQQTKVPDVNCNTIDWEKSTWNIPETTGLSADESLLLMVTYEKAPVKNS